jgi:hypothetical protein
LDHEAHLSSDLTLNLGVATAVRHGPHPHELTANSRGWTRSRMLAKTTARNGLRVPGSRRNN